MAEDKDKNAHHQIMDDMDRLGGSPTAETDYLDQVAKAAVSDIDELPIEVGPRVKAVREQRGLSLEDVAGRSGLGQDVLVSIESGDYAPPLGTLIRLGKALDMPMGTLITTGEVRPYAILRGKDRKAVARFSADRQAQYGYTYMPLAPDKKDRSMEPFIVTLEPTGGEHGLSEHDGEEFIFVMSGKLAVKFGDEEFVLEPGDSIYYDSTTPHLVTTSGDETTTILAVLIAAKK